MSSKYKTIPNLCMLNQSSNMNAKGQQSCSKTTDVHFNLNSDLVV